MAPLDRMFGNGALFAPPGDSFLEARRLKAGILEVFAPRQDVHSSHNAMEGDCQLMARRVAGGAGGGGGTRKIRRIAAPEDGELESRVALASSASCDPEYLALCYEAERKAAAAASPPRPGLPSDARHVLIDWLVEVVDEFKLGQTCLFLAVNIVDRYVARVTVPRRDLQLLGIAALWVASKFDEVSPPTLSDMVDVTQGSCSPAAIRAMEDSLLRELAFSLAEPTPLTFLLLFFPAAAANAADAEAQLSAAFDPDGADSDDSAAPPGGARPPTADVPCGPRAAPRYPYPIGAPASTASSGNTAPGVQHLPPGALGDFPRRLAHMSEYLAELSLLSAEASRAPPSLVAAASLHLACSLLGAPPGTRTRLAPAADGAAVRVGGEERLRACVMELQRIYAMVAKLPRAPAVRAKYSSPQRSSVATLPLPGWALMQEGA